LATRFQEHQNNITVISEVLKKRGYNCSNIGNEGKNLRFKTKKLLETSENISPSADDKPKHPSMPSKRWL
jgi:hypothetical protein